MQPDAQPVHHLVERILLAKQLVPVPGLHREGLEFRVIVPVACVIWHGFSAADAEIGERGGFVLDVQH